MPGALSCLPRPAWPQLLHKIDICVLKVEDFDDSGVSCPLPLPQPSLTSYNVCLPLPGDKGEPLAHFPWDVEWDCKAHWEEQSTMGRG